MRGVSSAIPATIQQEALLRQRGVAALRGQSRSEVPLALAVRVPSGTLTKDIEKAVSGLIGTHDSLRLTLRPGQNMSPHELENRAKEYYWNGWWNTGLYEIHSDINTAIEVGEEVCSRADLPDAIHAFVASPLTVNDDRVVGARVFTAGEDRMVVLAVDHVAADGISMGILGKRLQDRLRDPTSSCPASLASYRQFAECQADRISRGQFQAELEYWSDVWCEFSGATLSDKHLAAGESSAGSGTDLHRKVLRVQPAIEWSRGAVNMARQLGVSLFSVVAAATGLSLASKIGADRAGLWTTYANRDRSTFRTVGLLSTIHLLGIDCRCSQTHANLVRTTFGRLCEGRQRAEMPVQHLWNTLRGRLDLLDAGVLLEFRERAAVNDQDPSPWARVPVPIKVTNAFGAVVLTLERLGGKLFLQVNWSAERISDDLAATLLSDIVRNVERLSLSPPTTLVGHSATPGTSP